MKMKKFIALLAAMSLVFSLAACGSNEEKSGEKETVESVESTDGEDDTEAEEESEEGSEDADETEATDSETGDEEADSDAEEADGTVTITHDLGETEVAVNPEKLVVFDLGILDILSSVDIYVAGYPESSPPEYLKEQAGEPEFNAGGMKEVDFEAINEYGADLIIISGRVSDSYDECSEIAPTLYVSSGTSYIDALEHNIDIIASIFPEKADALQEKFDVIKADAAALQTKAQESGLNSLTLMANDGSLSFFGPDSRYSVINNDFGFNPAAEDIDDSTHGQEGTYEYIAELDPDVIFVIDRSAAIGTEGATGAETLLDNDLVNGTKAAQNDKIIYLSSDLWYLATGGLTSSAQMIEEVSAALD